MCIYIYIYIYVAELPHAKLPWMMLNSRAQLFLHPWPHTNLREGSWTHPLLADRHPESKKFGVFNIGALIIRIGFWGPLYYIYIIIRNPGNSIGNKFRPLH